MKLNEVHWEITNRCNLHCKHCLPMSGSPRKSELTTQEASAALEKFRAAGASNIYITGGEPFTRPDLISLLEKGVNLGMRLSVISNASLIGEETLLRLKGLGVRLGFSLDGADEETNDSIRGKGSFRTVIETLVHCKRIGIAPMLYVTITSRNFGQIEELMRLAKNHGCLGVHFNEVNIGGRAVSFADKLTLSPEQLRTLSAAVEHAASVVWGETLSATDDDCWVDGKTIYMTADGKLYVCSEVFQRRPDLAVGDIRSFAIADWLKTNVESLSANVSRCCYGMRASEHLVLMENKSPDCAFAPRRTYIETLEQFYGILDELYADIESNCKECSLCREYPDCLGYVWLLPKESERLYELGVSLLEINGGPTFINPFPESSNEKPPDLRTRYPVCSQLSEHDRRCTIHAERPLACHLYPIGLERAPSGKIVWALHLDCLHVHKLVKKGTLEDFKSRSRNIMNSLSPKLLGEIVETYRAVDAISSFPNGENNYEILQEAL